MIKNLPAPPDRPPASRGRPAQVNDSIVRVRVKRPALLAALSFFVPGLGQIVCAQDNKGVFLMGTALLGYWLTGGIATLMLCVLSSLDAFVVGRAIRQGAVLRKWDFLPGVKPFQKLPARTVPLIIFFVILALMTARVVSFANGGPQN